MRLYRACKFTGHLSSIGLSLVQFLFPILLSLSHFSLHSSPSHFLSLSHFLSPCPFLIYPSPISPHLLLLSSLSFLLFLLFSFSLPLSPILWKLLTKMEKGKFFQRVSSCSEPAVRSFGRACQTCLCEQF